MAWIWNNSVAILSVAVVVLLVGLGWKVLQQPVSQADRDRVALQLRDSEERLAGAKLRLKKALSNVGNFTRPNP
jgi:hypothetical protein